MSKLLNIYLISLLLLCFQSNFAGISSLVHNEVVESTIHRNAYRWTLMCAMIFQNEAPYLKEWIEYHKLIGVEHFFLYNNESTDHFRAVLQPYIDKGDVELIEWRGFTNEASEFINLQLNAYNDALKRVLKKSEWLAIIDADEFIVPVGEDHLHSILKRYRRIKNVGGISLRWIMFGTSFLDKIPDHSLLIESLIFNGGVSDFDANYKTIFRPEAVKYIKSPHYPAYKMRFDAIEVPLEQVQINHYWSRDQDFFYREKLPRMHRSRIPTPDEIWIDLAEHQFNHAKDKYSLTILRFVDKLREKINRTE